MVKPIDAKKFDEIIDGMVDVVDKSKEELYELTEASREEHLLLTKDLEQTRKEVREKIAEGDELEKEERIYRNRLAEVNKNFNIYSEEQIKDVYEKTHDLQAQLKMIRQQEKSLRIKRDYIERRLVILDDMIEKGSGLVTKVSIISNYLTDDFHQISELIKDANQKQTFGLKIIEAQEEERRRISREIHDGPAQMLANILLRVDIVERTFTERDREEALKEMQGMRSMVRQSLQEVRRIIYNLRPMTLDDLGLVPTIRKYLANVEDYQDISIDLSEHGGIERLSSKYEVAIFRLIQEAVQNAVKHAVANHIQVNLSIDTKQVAVSIRDDGIGFDKSEKKANSFGLLGMRERVEMLDGEFVINTKVGQGTTVYIKIPLK